MAFAQFRILFKKNFLLRRRQPVLFLFELVWPLLLFSIVAIVRKTSPIQNRPACFYNPMPLPNSGTIGFLQSFLCNTNVSCRLKPFDVQTSSLKNYLPSVYDGILGLTKTDGVNTVFKNLPNLTRSVDHINNAFNDTFFQKLLDGKFLITDLFNNTNELKNDLFKSGMSKDLIDDLLNGSFDLTDLYNTFNDTINFEPFCRNHFLNHILTVDNSTDANILIQALCQLNIRNFTMDLNVFVNDLNNDMINRYFGNLSQLLNEKGIQNDIEKLKDLEKTVKQLSSYAELLNNLPNLTEIARIIPRLIQIIELVQNQRDLIQLFGQIMADLHILTDERIILQLYEITQMFVDFLQRYDNMTQSLTAEQLFRNLSLGIILQSDLTILKKYESQIITSKINYLVLAEYIVGRITGVPTQRAFCLQPGYWTLFILDDETSQHLKERVDRYCGIPRNFDVIYNNFLNGIRYDQLQNYFLDMKLSLTAFQGLANILFTVNKAGSLENDLRLTMESVSAVSELFGRTKTAGLNLYASYNFVKQITRIFNPNLLTQPIFKTLDIAIPILTPLVNIDQLVSLIAGIPRGTIDNIVNSINEINNFLTTPTSTRMMRLTTTLNSSNIKTTTTKPRPRARYIDWSALFQPNNFLNLNISKAFGTPQNINAYTQWVKRQKRQLGLISGLLDQSQSLNNFDGAIPDFVKMFTSFTPEALELLCIEPLMNLIPNDPILNYIFGVGRLFELINTFMTIITSTDEIRCLRNPNKDYSEISQFLRLNKTVGLFRDLIQNRFQSKFSCSLIVDVVKNIQKYQNLVDIMQHNTITLDTLDCLKQTLLQTLERLKILPGLIRFIFSDASLIQSIKKLTPLIEILSPIFSQQTSKFVQINDMIEHANNLTSFLQQYRNITSLNNLYFNTRLGQLQVPSDLQLIFCDRNQMENFVISFHDSIEALEWSLCKSPASYNETYQQFIQQYGRTIQLKKFNGLNIERLFNEMPMIKSDFQLIINENQWLMELVNGISQQDISPIEIYKLFMNFTVYLPEFQRLKLTVSQLVEKYFWALPDESTQRMALSIVSGLDTLYNLSIILQNNLYGLPMKDVFQNLTFITNKLMRNYGFSYPMVQLFRQARLFKDPIILFNLYNDYHQTVCDVDVLNTTIYKVWPYLTFNEKMDIKNLSKYACESSLGNQTFIFSRIYKHFLVPEKLQMFFNRSGHYIVDLVNMDEKELDVFRQVGPIVNDVNELLKRVKRLDQQINTSENQDPLSKITSVFCAEIDKPSNPQRQVVNDDSVDEKPKDNPQKTNQTDPINQRISDVVEEDNKVDCQDIRRSIEQSSDVGYIVWPLIKPLLLGKILYAPATPVSNAIIAKVNKTFEELDKIHQFAKTWVESPVNLTALLGDLQNTNNIKKVLSNQLFQELFNNIIDMNTFDIQSIIAMLENLSGGTNPDVLRNIEIIMKQFSDYLPCIELNRFEALQSESELVERAKELHRNRMVIAGIVFSNLNSSNPNANFLPPHIHIKIRMDVDSVRTTEQITSWLFFPGPENDYFREMHYLRGFIQLQDLIERAVIDLHFEDTEKPSSNPVVYMQLMPYPCYRGDPGKESSYVNYFILPILGTLMWTATLGVSIKNLMRERERNVEQTMKIMGLNSTINFISWLISSFIPMIIVSIVVAVVLKYGGIFPASDLTVTITPLLTLAMSALMLGYLVSAFFSKANLATLCGILIYFISYLPFILIMFLEAKMKLVHKLLISLSSATAFGYASIYLTRFEYQGEGLQWPTTFKSIFPNDQMNFGVACVMMLVDSIIYGLIGKYARAVLPGKNALKKPFWYPCLPSTWCFCKKNTNGHDGLSSPFRVEREQQPNPFTVRMKQIDPNNEQEPTHLSVGIAFENLSKQFGQDKKAVENLSLKLYENQITALLGHNGAGKTTTINVLTGIYPPSNGSASIYGRNITTEYDQIRKNVGLCPQEDILFDFMTVREHLQFYGRLKGNMSSKELDRDINELLSSMGLWIFQHERVSSLSGGVRRRVSVSIAFVAGSRTVILDEPTSGVDPCARRSIWEVIFKHRAGRTILLTTHYLDEADTLSDRIAIIHQGRLLCSGSSMFLKKRFGKGYSLTIDLKFKVHSKIKIVESKQFKDVNAFILQEMPDATLREHIGSEITYSFKFEHRHRFEQLFKQLEVNKDRLAIGNYGLSDTTLEEVFLWVTELADQGKMDDSSENSTVPKIVIEQTPTSSAHSDDSGLGGESNATLDGISTISGSSAQLPTISHGTLTPLTKPTKITGRKLYFHQFQSLLLKRFHHTKRNWRVFLSHLILPLLFVAMSMGFTLLRPSQLFQRPWLLTPAMYDQSAMFVKLSNSNDPIAQRLDDRLRNNSYPNIGTTCLKDAPPASDQEPYKCGEGDKSFYEPPDSTDYNRYARCSDCFTKTLQICPADSFGRPPTRKTKSGIVLYDLNNFTINEYLLKSHHAFTDNRYGGLTFGEQIEDDYFNRSHALVWFNNKGYHALPSYLNVMNNLILRSKISDPTTAGKFGISTYSHPFTLNSDLLSQQSLEQRISDFGIAITVLCAYAFVPAAVILYLVREYVTQEKRLIFICGVKPLIYWLSTFIWDLVYYLILIGLTMILIKIFNISAFNSRVLTTRAIFCLLFLYGWSSIPLVYCMVRLFKDTGTAFMTAFCIWLFSGMITCVADLMLTLYAWVPGIVRVQSILSRFFLIFPSYCLGSGLVHLMRNELVADFGRTIDADLYINPFSMSLVGDRIAAMSVIGFVALIVTYILDLDIRLPNILYKIPPPETTVDKDVMEERHRILHSNETHNDLLQAKNLTKCFRRATGQSLLAVDHLCFGISKGQCFGLLGINGAGKTTTFKMITGDVHPTSGACLLYEKQIRNQAREYPGSIGYCPQFDAVDGYLTSREALMCYAKLIGITDREHVVNLTLRNFHMDSFADRIIRTYSGGMRRKLSVAVAMLGQPDLILLDEPTNGMDPGNRRIVWNNIIKAKKQDKAILLTSHSMAECDVLCSRLAIMVNGQFKCLGTPQHLKHRFGTGYYLKLRLEHESSIQIASNIIHQYLPDSNMTERHGTRLEYNIPKTYLLSKIFGFIETNKTLMNVMDYSLSQTTLEHVFLRFASKQRDNSIANLEDVIIDDTASIASSAIHSFIHTTEQANNTFPRRSPSSIQIPNDASSQTAADLRELPVIDSCTDLVLNVDRPPSSASNASSQQDEHVFRI